MAWYGYRTLVNHRPDLSRLDCLSLLRRHATHVGRLAMLDENERVEIYPMYYRLVGEDVVLAVQAPLVDGLTRRSVCFEIEDMEPSTLRGWSVVVHGIPERSEDPYPEELPDVLSLRRWIPPDSVYLRLPVEEVIGRRLG